MLSQIDGAAEKTIMASASMARTAAARRMDGGRRLLGRNDPITLPAPRAAMKTPDQSADEWKTCPASAGPRTRIGSAATVMAATISRRTMTRGSSTAMSRPFITRERFGACCLARGRRYTRTRVKRKNEPAFRANASPKPTVVKIRMLMTGASARPRL